MRRYIVIYTTQPTLTPSDDFAPLTVPGDTGKFRFWYKENPTGELEDVLKIIPQYWQDHGFAVHQRLVEADTVEEIARQMATIYYAK